MTNEELIEQLLFENMQLATELDQMDLRMGMLEANLATLVRILKREEGVKRVAP